MQFATPARPTFWTMYGLRKRDLLTGMLALPASFQMIAALLERLDFLTVAGAALLAWRGFFRVVWSDLASLVSPTLSASFVAIDFDLLTLCLLSLVAIFSSFSFGASESLRALQRRVAAADWPEISSLLPVVMFATFIPLAYVFLAPALLSGRAFQVGWLGFFIALVLTGFVMSYGLVRFASRPANESFVKTLARLVVIVLVGAMIVIAEALSYVRSTHISPVTFVVALMCASLMVLSVLVNWRAMPLVLINCLAIALVTLLAERGQVVLNYLNDALQRAS